MTKAFAGHTAIDGVSFCACGGEFLALLGPSGAGKTALLRCMCGLTAPDSGTVKLDGADIAVLARRERRRIAVVFQQFNLIGRLTALDNVLAGRLGYVPAWRGMLRRFHRDDRLIAMACLDRVGLLPQTRQRAGVDVVTDGEQRRDSYASFVGGLLDNCQLIPLTDLLPLVDDPEEFERELRALDVPASDVRHPAVFGPLGRSRPLAVHELDFVKTLTAKPVKVALPGPIY